MHAHTHTSVHAIDAIIHAYMHAYMYFAYIACIFTRTEIHMQVMHTYYAYTQQYLFFLYAWIFNAEFNSHQHKQLKRSLMQIGKTTIRQAPTQIPGQRLKMRQQTHATTGSTKQWQRVLCSRYTCGGGGD